MLAATNNKPAVKNMAMGSMNVVHEMPPKVQVLKIDRKTTAFSVSPSTDLASHSKYSNKIPVAVKASDDAI